MGKGTEKKLLRQIRSERNNLEGLSDEMLKERYQTYKASVTDKKQLDSLMAAVFALVGECVKRVTGFELHDCQYIGGMHLHRGRIVEMKTGEGKTLVGILPAALNALEGKGVHIITVNEYLATRDAEEMGKIFHMLGLTVGTSLNEMEKEEKKKAYACDITYVTNSEAGFDYLRDNMVSCRNEKVQRGFNFCIIDEADSVLIDEARTPLIIAGAGDTDAERLYTEADELARTMVRSNRTEEYTKDDFLGDFPDEDGDFIYNEKDRYTALTKQGLEKANAFHGFSITDPEHTNEYHALMSSLQAHTAMHKDKEYIEKDGEILIVDDFTGRTLAGRRFQDGLHQAIEAKERVKINLDAPAEARVTYQSFFKMYEKVAGMTGTAYTDKKEIRATYGLKTVMLETNKPVIRTDEPDILFETKEVKYRAIVEEIRRCNETGQPVLVGTPSIEVSEVLHRLLNEAGITHHLLNAKQHKHEADIVSRAGQKRAVTIATNMAGRGTDIKLGHGVAELGGLRVIGTERHESRRIDDQLRGRSGRQGDPGSSVFYVSLEDEVLELYGTPALKNIFRSVKDSSHGIQSKAVSRAIRKAQKGIEGANYSSRKHVNQYGMVEEIMRLHMYSMRDTLIRSSREEATEEDKEATETFMHESIRDFISYIWHTRGVSYANTLEEYMPHVGANRAASRRKEAERCIAFYDEVCSNMPFDQNTMEAYYIIGILDIEWKNYLKWLESRQNSISIVSYSGKDPLIAFKNEAVRKYTEVLYKAEFNSLRMMLEIPDKTIYIKR